MNDILVSVVIPVYNVEKYLDRCIASVANQTYKNLEIILVDDGSKDSCPEMCDAWKQRDHRIKVVHKENQGLGLARNTGMDNATGEYICFVDSDDYIDKDTVKASLEAALDSNADIAVYGMKIIDSEGRIVKSKKLISDTYVFNGSEITTELVPDMLSVDYSSDRRLDCGMSMCELLVSLDLIRRHNWRMVSEREIISEDVYSLIELYSYANKVVIVPENYYNYCMNENSLTHVYRPDRHEKIKVFYEKSVVQCREYGYTRTCETKLASVYYSFVIGAIKTILSSSLTTKEQKAEIRKIIEDDHLQKVIKEIDKRNENLKRKILIKCIKIRSTLLCYLCFKLQG